MPKELDELRAKAVEADALLEQLLASLRDAAAGVNSLGLLAGDLHREAADCEFEEIPAAVRAHLDGRLLQRTGYVGARAADCARKLRELADGVRNLRRDCAALVALVPAPTSEAPPSTGGTA